MIGMVGLPRSSSAAERSVDGLVHYPSSGEDRPRVLHVSPLPPPWGGVASNLSYLLGAKQLSSFEMAVLNTARRRYREDMSPTKKIWHAGRLLQALRMFCATRRAIERFHPAIVHIQSAGDDLSAIRDMLLITIASRKGLRVVFHEHFWADPAKFNGPRRTFAFFYKRLIPRAAAVLMSSPLHIEQAAKLIDITRAHEFPNTCVPPEMPPAHRLPREGECQVVYVGRLSHLKGTYDLIEAIRLIVQSSYRFKFLLIGVGATAEDEERLKRLIAEYRISEAVVLAGRVTDEEKWRILWQSHIMVFPTLGELFPVTLIEGLAAGLPIITTSVDYLPRLIVHGENGLIVPPAAPTELAAALQLLGRDADAQRRMSSANRLKFEREFALDIVAGKLRDIYESLLPQSESESHCNATSVCAADKEHHPSSDRETVVARSGTPDKLFWEILVDGMREME